MTTLDGLARDWLDPNAVENFLKFLDQISLDIPIVIHTLNFNRTMMRAARGDRRGAEYDLQAIEI
jgi:hypothetical protein